ncbi:hypothetical protein [Flavilitoribacter nigricans]|uniref:DUF5362 domain-containing protein n=1 Tax=Flavilitoribacter nigricans (strain ATCC 23147 / DSM 23189 / NBRC 102662 / NCIMB 1420 / SS-2) TaxID=1122177 RepID=A0A2D0NH78_FLAN2|nr:hypothetical protein [Flavilitoribacter nigricans]PHN07123.1 hypothetical protein CRP01_07800 [Flavilitoribacter nigricans DSM 23189 = NBRC 102662]
MEEQIIDDASYDLTLSDQMRNYIKETAKWAQFIAIMAFIGLGFMALGAFFIGAVFSMMTMQMGYGMSGGLVTVIYLALLLLIFFPVFYLYRFSSKTQIALRIGSDAQLTDAFQNLKSHYKFVGILIIASFALNILMFIISLFFPYMFMGENMGGF